MERWINARVASGAMGAIAALLAMAGLCGCAALMMTPDMNDLSGPGNIFTGYMTAKSTVKLNRANEQLSRAQAQMTAQQAIDLQTKREQLKAQRPVTIGILRDMAVAQHQPLFADLAQWVAAGGDPQYAMNYALTHQQAPPPNSPAPEASEM